MNVLYYKLSYSLYIKRQGGTEEGQIFKPDRNVPLEA
jgi:hypothetical protein